MQFKVSGPGLVYGGHAKMNLNQVEDCYLVDYSIAILLGRKIFGRFVGKTLSYSGQLRVPSTMFSEANLKICSDLAFNGMKLTKVSQEANSALFLFSKSDVSGQIYFTFDGLDPVEIQRIDIDYAPIGASLVLTAV